MLAHAATARACGYKPPANLGVVQGGDYTVCAASRNFDHPHFHRDPPIESPTTSADFLQRQRRAFATAWMAYAAYYLCRLNLAGTQAAIETDLGLSKERIGAMITLFSLVYGAGQLVNGALCDRFGARRMLTLGLVGSAVVNLIFSTTASFVAMCALWGLNGVFQSMGWSSCIKTLSHWFPSKQRGRAAGWFSLSYNLGNVAAWIAAGWLVTLHWRWAFRAPALIVVLVGLHTFLRLEESPDGEQAKHTSGLPLRSAAGWALTCAPLWVAAFSCFAAAIGVYGFVSWLPHYLTEMSDSSLVGNMKACFFPLGACVGAVSVGWLSDHVFHGRRQIAIALALLGGAALTVVLGCLPRDAGWLLVPLVMLTGGLMVGGHAHIVSTAAMEVSSRQTTGTATGVIDASGYLGAAVTGLGSGWLVEHIGWGAAFALWASGAALGAITICFLRTPSHEEAPA